MKTGWRISKEGRHAYQSETDGRIVLGTPNENGDQFQLLNGIQEYVVLAKLDSLTVRKVERLHIPSCKLLRFEEGIEWISLWGSRNTVFTKVIIPSSVKVIVHTASASRRNQNKLLQTASMSDHTHSADERISKVSILARMQGKLLQERSITVLPSRG